ncbi:hypothetical protein KP509_19G045000 [Ceratopteris richardii]|uniref:Protein arginine N-methyltransferase domain-containing protein n=1 Tax=Ceratopteris richardii TaxID=49495 RepID=A0A8T2SKS0_CERRI|nr:hypothetical protein KP509_19G045000 [Ceratopteris richardii]
MLGSPAELSVGFGSERGLKAKGGRRKFPRSDYWGLGGHISAAGVVSSPPRATACESVVSNNYAEIDAAYFNSYTHVGVHEEMIKDRVRTETYRNAIFQHANFIKDKVVVDVGCGTGILSIFCAYAGARKVYAVDASEIAIQAREVVKANGLSETIIVLLGRIEEVEIGEEVDVIISEWMGYMLLYESMLSSVIYARDRWLKPGGIILPSHATLYLAPVTNAERYAESIDFWRNVYGIDMSAMLPLAKQCSFEEPCVESITAENIMSWPVQVYTTSTIGEDIATSHHQRRSSLKHIDCSSITVQELESVTSNFSVTSMMTGALHGFALWFDVTFSGPTSSSSDTQSESSLESSLSGGLCANGMFHKSKRAKMVNQLVLSTAPEDIPTHWQQTVLYIYDPIEVKQDEQISGSITVSQSKENPRFLNIHLEYKCRGRCYVKETVMR